MTLQALALSVPALLLASIASAQLATYGSFGFVDTRDGAGFAFWLRGPDIAEGDENIVLWTNPMPPVSDSFFLEWIDPDRGVWHSLSGTLTATHIAEEAVRRGLALGDYDGVLVEPGWGSHILALDGTGEICALPGAACDPQLPGAVYLFLSPLSVMLESGPASIEVAGEVTFDVARGSFSFGAVDHDPVISTLESDTLVKGPGEAVFVVPEPSATALLVAALAALGLLRSSRLE